MKFVKDQRVTIVALNERGAVLHAFPFKDYAQPDQIRYTVQTESGRYECNEDELSA